MGLNLMFSEVKKNLIELAIEHMLISVGHSIVLQDIVSGRELL